MGQVALRDYLQDELIRRCQKNNRYSLRAFAKSMSIPASLLSMILNEKRPVTQRTLLRLVKRLDIAPSQIKEFSQQLSLSPTRASGKPTTPSIDYKQIAADHFQVISEWYHYALIELIDVKGFRPDPRWAARALGVSVAEVKSALNRLKRIGLISIDAKGHWKNTSGHNTNLDNESVAVARRRLQRQILEKALTALEEIPVEERDQSSMTMAIDRRLLPEAKRRITQFRRKLTHYLQKSRTPNEVFHLSISLYPVTRLTQKENLTV